ncbi:solute carrier family 35 member C2 [Venturia canescens]|uniref:solute carrier family 35 member C2 n=1 Tax=Venturia canescens TaxID=32260 RepID=UPI001C9CA315|nr:solute carrier family 35 member C2 [Venturia canescens]
MPSSNVKYEIARQDPDGSDYYLQHVPEFQNASRWEKSFWHGIFQSIFLISIYFILSVGLTFYQQWLYEAYKFLRPLSVVLCHLVVKFLLALLVRSVRKCAKGREHCQVPWQTILSSLAPPGIASGLDVGFSNWAMSLITISLYTMTKSTSIIFILGFSVLLKLEKKSWSLAGVVVMISMGLMMFTYKSVQFDLLGFLLCLFAALSSGLRWTMAQLVMQKSKLGMSNPVDMMYYMQPWMLFAILPVALYFESGTIYDSLLTTDWNNASQVLSTTAAVLAGAILAFNMEIMEFVVVTYTSSLTLSITGVLKEMCIVILAVEFKGDSMTGLNFIGLLMCLGGIVMHVIQKVLKSSKDMMEKLELQSNSVTTIDSNCEDQMDSNLPLLAQKSTSLTNLLNSNFSSDEEEDGGKYTGKDKDDTTQVLFDVLQRREQS